MFRKRENCPSSMIFRATRMACKEFDAIIIIVWDSHDSKARYISYKRNNR